MGTKDLAYYLALKYPAEVREGASGGYFVSHPDLDGCMAEGVTLDEAMENLAFARELWIESRLAGSYPVPEPSQEDFSGKVSLRMSPSLHSQLAKLAAQKDISLNLLMNTVLAEYVGGASQVPDLSRIVEEFRTIAADMKASATSQTSMSPTFSDFVRQGAKARATMSQGDNVLDFCNRTAQAAT